MTTRKNRKERVLERRKTVLAYWQQALEAAKKYPNTTDEEKEKREKTIKYRESQITILTEKIRNTAGGF